MSGFVSSGLPSPIVIFIITFEILFVGIFDFFKPEIYLGVGILTFIAIVTLFVWIVTHNEKPYMTKWTVIENGISHEEDGEMPGGATIKTLAVSIGLFVVSVITYFVPWTRLTSMIFIGFGSYAVVTQIWVYYEIYFKKESK